MNELDTSSAEAPDEMQCLEEYASLLKEPEKAPFLNKLKEPMFFDKAQKGLKNLGMFLAISMLKEADLDDETKLELSKLTKKIVLDTKSEPKEVVEMKIFYLRNYQEFDPIEEMDDDTKENYKNRVISLLGSLEERLKIMA